MGGRAWSTDQEERLFALIAEGLSQREIGRLIGRSEQAVANRCRKYNLRNPQAAKRNSADAQRRVFRDRNRRAEIAGKISASWTPERRQRQREIAKTVNAKLGYRAPTPEGRKRMTNGIVSWHRKRWAWLPEKYRDEYVRLARNPRIKADRAKEIIRAKIEAERGEMTPFERAMERIRNGASIVEVRPIRRPDPTFTLGGVSDL